MIEIKSYDRNLESIEQLKALCDAGYHTIMIFGSGVYGDII